MDSCYVAHVLIPLQLLQLGRKRYRKILEKSTKMLHFRFIGDPVPVPGDRPQQLQRRPDVSQQSRYQNQGLPQWGGSTVGHRTPREQAFAKCVCSQFSPRKRKFVASLNSYLNSAQVYRISFHGCASSLHSTSWLFAHLSSLIFIPGLSASSDPGLANQRSSSHRT